MHFHPKNDSLAPTLHENQVDIHIQNNVINPRKLVRHNECVYISGTQECVVHQRSQPDALEAIVRTTVSHLDYRLLPMPRKWTCQCRIVYKR
jgi:hypothetical protein